SKDRPFCTFYNEYRNEEGTSTKKSSGVVLHFQHGIYCVGRVLDRDDTTTPGLKVFILPNQNFDDAVLHGFVVTRDADAKIIIARAAFERTAAKTSNEAQPTVIPFEEVYKRVSVNILKRIRNSIDFEIGREIHCNQLGRNISSQEMVDIVKELCGGR